MDDDDDDEEVEEGAPAWMATFSDMATLLLTFFVLLLSFANLDVIQFRTLMGSVRNAFGVVHENPGDFQARSDSPITVSEGGSPNTVQLLPELPSLVQIEQRLQERGLQDVVEAEIEERGVVLRMRDAILFESGSDVLLEDALPLLTEIGMVAAEFTHDLAIEGHTDDRPINTVRFPSNWELSAARATAVLRHLSATGTAPTQMSIAGYADTRPVDDNTTNEGRSRNRRVEFVFLRPRAIEQPEGAVYDGDEGFEEEEGFDEGEDYDEDLPYDEQAVGDQEMDDLGEDLFDQEEERAGDSPDTSLPVDEETDAPRGPE